jgi:Abortive infection alpha
MGDNSLLPISDEQAKLGQELVKAARDGGGYFADILGDFPKDLFGLLVGDRVKAKRIERIAALWQKTRERLQVRGTDPESPSLKYAIPILEAAADEENEELQDLWSRLLAAAMDPNRRDAMRQSFIATVKQMDPMDTLVLKAIHDHGPGEWHPSANLTLATQLKCSTPTE